MAVSEQFHIEVQQVAKPVAAEFQVAKQLCLVHGGELVIRRLANGL